MEVKLLLILLLVLVLLLNFYTSENFFNDHRSDDQNPIAKHIGEELGRMMDNKNYFDVSEYIDIKITNQNDRDWYLERGNFSLPKNKILITLFYDPNDRFSRMFYDDTEKIYEDYMLEQKKDDMKKKDEKKNKKIWNRIKDYYAGIDTDTDISLIKDDFIIEEVKMDKGQMNSFNEIESRVIEYVKPTEILKMADYNEIQKYPRITQSLVKSLEPTTFKKSKNQQKKEIIVSFYSKTDDDDKHQDVYVLNESQISDLNEDFESSASNPKSITFHVSGNYKLYKKYDAVADSKIKLLLDIYDDTGIKISDDENILNFQNEEISGSFISLEQTIEQTIIKKKISAVKLVHIWENDNNFIKDLSNIRIFYSYFVDDKTFEAETDQKITNPIEIRHPKRQPPRPKDLLDKLPKIIASYVKDDKYQYITEYESYYNFGNEYNKVAVKNFKKFVDFIKKKAET